MSDPTTPDTPEPSLPPSLRLLKWLVVVLTLTMIGGVITVVALLVTRMPQSFATEGPKLPESITLPAGVTASAVTFGHDWIAVVTDDNHILILDQAGKLRQDIAIQPIETP